MINRKELTGYLDSLLKLEHFSADHSNNGLQVEGAEEIRKIVFGVDASLELFQRAVEADAQMVFVHHGISWGAEPRRFTGMHAGRLRFLFGHNLNLYAAHLPLDANAEVGNNAVLSQIGNLADLQPFCEYDHCFIGFEGRCTAVETVESLTMKYESALGCKAVIGGCCEKTVRKVGVVSGGGGNDALFAAAASGAQVLVTGELNHEMYHYAKELNVAVIALGHYASETTGVNAVCRHLTRKFDLACEFIDLPTGL